MIPLIERYVGTFAAPVISNGWPIEWCMASASCPRRVLALKAGTINSDGAVDLDGGQKQSWRQHELYYVNASAFHVRVIAVWRFRGQASLNSGIIFSYQSGNDKAELAKSLV